MRSPLWPKPSVGGTLAAWCLGARQAGELIGVVEGRKERTAHQEDRGQAGENRAGEPAPVDRAPNRRLVGLLADGQRRLDAEIDGQTVDTGHSRAKASRPPHDRPILPESARSPLPSPEKPHPQGRFATLRHTCRSKSTGNRLPIAELRRILGRQCGRRCRKTPKRVRPTGPREIHGYFYANEVLTGAESAAYICPTRGRCCRWRHWNSPSVLSIADCEKIRFGECLFLRGRWVKAEWPDDGVSSSCSLTSE